VLERLTIRDLAVIERAEFTLAPGLNVVTGETGAGKSLVVQAVSLLVGARGGGGGGGRGRVPPRG
jgi:DNA repair protein RecN (Recombination protein N)